MSGSNPKEYDAFLSFSHDDIVAVRKVYHFLSKQCNLKIYFDEETLDGGANYMSELADKINNSKAVICFISASAINKKFVTEEWNHAINYSLRNDRINIVPIRLDETAYLNNFLGNRSAFDIPEGNLTGSNAMKLLKAIFHYSFYTDVAENSKLDIYLSASWREDEMFSQALVAELIQQKKRRFIGDSPDQLHSSEDRIESIIKSCGGLLAIMPCRDNGSTSKYILQEIEIAKRNNIPVFLVAEEGVDLSKFNDEVIIIPQEKKMDQSFLKQKAKELEDDFGEAKLIIGKPSFIFAASNFENRTMIDIGINLIEGITGMVCKVGDNVLHSSIIGSIVSDIQQCILFVADISESDKSNMNTLIECGIAMGANKRSMILCSGERKSPPFMLRNEQVFYYMDEVEFIGIIVKQLSAYKRKIYGQIVHL